WLESHALHLTGGTPSEFHSEFRSTRNGGFRDSSEGRRRPDRASLHADGDGSLALGGGSELVEESRGGRRPFHVSESDGRKARSDFLPDERTRGDLSTRRREKGRKGFRQTDGRHPDERRKEERHGVSFCRTF